MLVLSLLLEKAGHEADAAWTSHTDIHDYQRRGPGPDMALWKSRSREDETRRSDGERVETLRRVKWTNEMEKALK
jgi:hypothetical protein